VTLSYPRASTALRNATFLKIIKKTREGSICSPLIRRGSSLIVSGTIRDSRHVPMRVAAKFPLSSAKKSYSVSSSGLEHGRIYARRSVTSTPRSKVAVNYVARNDTLARNEDLWRLGRRCFRSRLCAKDRSFIAGLTKHANQWNRKRRLRQKPRVEAGNDSATRTINRMRAHVRITWRFGQAAASLQRCPPLESGNTQDTAVTGLRRRS